MVVMWFASYVNLVTSHWARTLHTLMHDTHALSKNGVPKYPSSLAGTQADLNLGKITASHFQVLNTQKCR